jgi:hypothetical protein
MRGTKHPVIAVLGVVAVLGASLAGAQTPPTAQTPDVLARVYACVEKTADAERLACYDAAVGALKTAQATGEVTAIDKGQARQIERESFGFNLPSLPTIAFPNLFGGPSAEQPTEAVASTIRSVSGASRPTFTLENGQAWQSVDSETNRNARTGAAVTIRKAFGESFLMSVEAGGPAIRVRRVQ